MNATQRRTPETVANLEPGEAPPGTSMTRMPAGPDYWPVPAQPTSARRRTDDVVGDTCGCSDELLT